jgi:HAE1 family hydrophobic/amphiphilic exporter-1
MLMVAAVLLGAIAYRSMRVEQNPEVQFGVVTVTTVYPGAGPEEVNTLVSRKVEEAVSGVGGLIEVTSTSQEGVSNVVAQFEVGTDMDVALNEIRAKVDAVLNALPREIEKPTISKIDAASEPVLTMALRSEQLTNQQLRDLADERLKDRFARIPGVASVIVSGGDVRELQVQIRKDRLLAYGVGISDITRAIQAATINAPSGRIVDGDREFSVRVIGEFATIDDLRDMRLSVQNPNNPNAKAAIVRLGDVAEVTDAVAERRVFSRLDGSDAVVLTVQKAREGNAVEISAAAEGVIAQIESEYGVRVIKTLNQATLVKESLFDLTFALLFGIVLVTLIVYMFLHNLRGTLIVAIAIPICIFATFMVLWALGFTINNMSMLALSLAVGVLVDDCIVVLENIYRHLKMGEEPVEAALNGRGEIGLAAIAITLADVVVFVPIAFMGGVVGQFFKPLAIGFVVAVLLSLFVSFTVTPMLASRWYRKGEDVEHATGRFAVWFERMFSRLEQRYRRALEWSLRHRWFVFISGFVVLVGVFMFIGGGFQSDVAGAARVGVPLLMFSAVLGVVVFVGNLFRRVINPKLLASGLLFGLAFPVFAVLGFFYGQWKGDAVFKFQFFPESDSGQVIVRVELPAGSSLAATTRVVERIEAISKTHPDVEYVLSSVGTRGGGFGPSDTGPNFAQVRLTLFEKRAILDSIMFWVKHEKKLRVRRDSAVAADIQTRLGRIAGATVLVSVGEAQGFGSPIQMSFASDDRALLVRTVQKIRDGLQAGAIKGVISPEISSKEGVPEIRAIPDRARLADAGLTTADLAGIMRVLYEGNDTTKFRVQGREYDIRVMMALEDRNDPRVVEQIPLSFSEGQPIYLTQVAEIRPGVGLDKVERRNRTEEIRINANLLPGFAAGTVQGEINQWLERERMLPNGVVKKELGQADVQRRESGYLFGALLLGLVLVYMVLASLYDNLLYPFIIQLAQPQALVGAILALVLTDKSLNIVGFIGVIALVGLVGKNAILLVDYTNTLRARGRDRHDALVEAGPVRLRPIMMTTLAVILGMLPVALAIGRGSEFRETIGITIIGGITLSTLLTLLVIPCSYTIFDDLSNWAGRIGRGRSQRKGAGSVLAPEPLGAPGMKDR